MPTTQLISNPSTYSVINSELYFRVTSTASSNDDFQYIFDLYTYSPTASYATASYLGRYDIPPRPETADGIYSPSRSLKSKIGYDLNAFIPYTIYATSSIVSYGVQYGYKYNPNLIIDSTFNGSGFLGFVVSSISGASASTYFNIGETITVRMDNQLWNPEYNTDMVITSLVNFGSLLIGTDQVYVTQSAFTGLQTGKIIQQSYIAGTSPKLFALNATKQYDQNYLNFGDEYLQRSSVFSTGKWNNYLSNYKTDGAYGTLNQNGYHKSIFLDNYETTSYLLDRDSISYGGYYILTYDTDLNFIQSYTFSANLLSSNYKRIDLVSGCKNLMTLGVDFTNVKYYACLLSGTSSILDINSIRSYRIDDNCSPYDNVRIAFQNRQGAFDYWNFNQKNVKNTSIERTQYKKALPFDYNIGDRGETILSIKANNNYTISTDYILSDYESSFLEEIKTSKEVYVIDEVNKRKYPIIITDTDFTFKTKLNDKLFCCTLSFKYAYDINLQSD